MNKYLQIGLALTVLVYSSPSLTFAAAFPVIRESVTVCDPNAPTNCIKPAADGSISVTGGGGGGSAVTTSPAVVIPTDRAGSVTTGGTAQTAIAANASRKGWCIQNPTTATEVLYIRSGGTATTTNGVVLAVGAQACNPSGIVDQGIVSVLGATTGHLWLGTEYQ